MLDILLARKNIVGAKYMENESKEIIIYSIKQVATMLHTSPNYVYSLVNDGKLKAIKLRSLKVLKSSLLEFLEANEGNIISDLEKTCGECL